MAYCPKCGKEVMDEAEVCVHCGCRIKGSSTDDKNVLRFVLTFFLGWIGSLIINHSEFKPNGWRCRTGAYIGLTILTCGIYAIVASISNFSFDPKKDKNIGWIKESK